MLRLFFVVLLGIALGVGVYFGLVVLYNRYVVPVQAHSIQIAQLETREVELRAAATRGMSDVRERLDTVRQQSNEGLQAAAALETRVAAVATAQEALAGSLDELQADLTAAQAAQEATQAELERLEAAGEPLQEGLETVQTAQEQAQSALDAVQSEQASLLRAVEALQGEVEALEEARAEAADRAALESGAPDAEALAALRRDLTVLRAMDLLTRARMLLLQSNYALAGSNVRAARDLLVAQQSDAPAAQAQALGEVVERLDAALDDLPGLPVAAADEIDGAWQLLAAGLPVEETSKPLPSLTATTQVTATVSPTPIATPRATATPTPSS
jgi:chromosome segregation ATPase